MRRLGSQGRLWWRRWRGCEWEIFGLSRVEVEEVQEVFIRCCHMSKLICFD